MRRAWVTLFVPRRRVGWLARQQLWALLGRGVESKLTLVSAPAGFGKTTLLAGWVAAAAGERSVAWLSLDGGDDDAVRFWTYVVTALRQAAPGVGADSLPRGARFCAIRLSVPADYLFSICLIRSSA